MPNMDYPGPCLSCISDTCGLWDDNDDKEKTQTTDDESSDS